MYRTTPERCAEKVPYTAEWVAKSAARALSWVGLSLHPYHCNVCDYWHLTHYRQPDDEEPAPVQTRAYVILSI